MGKASKEEKLQAIRPLCEDMRRKGGVEWRTGVIYEERKEYFRGKDLERFFQKNPDKLKGVVDTEKALRSQLEELCSLMIQTQLALPSERFYKKPHPGRKWLVKWPRKLSPVHVGPGQAKFNPDHFYVWLDDRPISPLQIAMSILMAVVVVAACLFPLAPTWLRTAVLYALLALVAFLFGLLLVRFLLFMVVFTLSGYEFWLFPNLVSEEVSVIEAFVPFVSFEKPKDGKSHIGTRVGGFAAVVATTYMLYKYSPDDKGIDLRKVNDSILDMIHSMDKPSIGAGGGVGAGGGGAYQSPLFGNDRNIDPEKLRQKILFEKQRQREEAARQAAEAEAPPAEGSADDANVDSADVGEGDGTHDGAADEPEAAMTSRGQAGHGGDL